MKSSQPATALAARAPFISAAELAGMKNQYPLTSLLDVRWVLGAHDGAARFAAGHLPGAVYVDMETELAAPATVEAGRHPLPAVEDFAAAVQRWGVRSGAPVVVYDDNAGMSAARCWWLLKHAGIEPVFILDGGLAAWLAAGGELDEGEVQAPEPGDAVVHFGAMPVINQPEAAEWPERGSLLDARSPERYRGETEPVDPRAGHIPGALNSPTAANLDSDGKLLPAAKLSEKFAPLRDDVAVYCGSGVTASHHVAVLAAAGIDAALYPGSWSQWSANPELPVATSRRRAQIFSPFSASGS